jgi:putrescine:ornithine antiporter
VALCQAVVAALKDRLALAELGVDWVPLGTEGRFRAVQRGQVDLLCGADSVTLGRRQEVSFSIPIFAGGIGAAVRRDAPARLKEVLGGQSAAYRPSWRASAGQLLQTQVFSVVSNTTASTWLANKLDEIQVSAEMVPVSDYAAGIRRLLERRANVLFGDRAILLDAVAHGTAPGDLMVLDRQFTYEPLALVLPRGDEDLRLVVDRALSRIYASGEIGGLYATWLGEPDEKALSFFRANILPE